MTCRWLTLQLFHIQLETTKPCRVVVTANGVPLPMEIDTGASVSIIIIEESLRAIYSGRSFDIRTPGHSSQAADVHVGSDHTQWFSHGIYP